MASKPETYKMVVKLGGARVGKKAVSFPCEIEHLAIGTMAQTITYMCRAQLNVVIYEKDQTAKLSADDKMMKIAGVVNTAKVSHDTDHLSLTLSFDLDSVNKEAIFFFANSSSMMQVEHKGKAGKVPHADDDKNQSTLEDHAKG